MEELLIESVRNYKILYDPENKFYHDVMRKENAWTEISRNIELSVSECKKMWTSLRDNFRKALKVRKTSSGQANILKKKWKYEEIMSFMIPFYKERRQKSSIKHTDTQSEENNEHMSMSEDEPISPPVVEIPNPPRSVSPVPSSSATSSNTTKTKRQQTSQVAEVLQNYLREKHSLKVEKKSDLLHKYFDAVQETVRTFTPQLQIEIKSKISAMLSEYELKNFNIQQQQQAQLSAQTDQYIPQLTPESPHQDFQSGHDESYNGNYDSSYRYHN